MQLKIQIGNQCLTVFFVTESFFNSSLPFNSSCHRSRVLSCYYSLVSTHSRGTKTSHKFHLSTFLDCQTFKFKEEILMIHSNADTIFPRPIAIFHFMRIFIFRHRHINSDKYDHSLNSCFLSQTRRETEKNHFTSSREKTKQKSQLALLETINIVNQSLTN